MRKFFGEIMAGMIALSAGSANTAEAGDKKNEITHKKDKHTSNEHGNEKEIIEKKEKAWLEQQPKMDVLNNYGAKKFFTKENLPDIDGLFMDSKEELCCIDEGVANIQDSENKMSMAGSGILFPAATRDERLERVADLCIKKNIKHVTSHDGCGAAGLAWQRDGKEAGTGSKTGDEYGRKWSQDLTQKIKDKLAKADTDAGVKYDNITKEKMVRPPEFHDARTVWFDTTSKFNPYTSKNLPKGFLIDYGLEKDNGKNQEEKEYPFAELKVAIGIAFGDHGFGKKFTTENPLIVVVIDDTESEMSALQQKISELVNTDENTKANAAKIKIDGFVK